MRILIAGMEEITADYPQEVLRPIVLPKKVPRVSFGARTDLGRVRENNEDKFEFFIPEEPRSIAQRGLVFVVCDGMGGHAAGQIASELAAKTFLEVYLSHPSDDAAAAAHSAVLAANRFVLDTARTIPARRGMGTTFTALMLIEDRVLLAHVGDSRAYRLRSGELVQLSTDHTWCDEVVRLGIMSREEAEQHPHRHMLSRAIGTESDVTVDILWFETELDDVYLLCSDGLVNFVSDEEIGKVLAENGPCEATRKLVELALVGGGGDNCTAIVIRVDALENFEA
jgi:protein phosphatase